MFSYHVYIDQNPKGFFSQLKWGIGYSSSNTTFQEDAYLRAKSLSSTFITEFENDNDSYLKRRDFRNHTGNPY